MEDIIRQLLVELGEDPEREGLLKTPQRVKRSFEFLTEGYKQDPVKIISDAVFTDKYDEMVIVKDIPFYSLCEHHLLPFYGHAHVAYLPNKKLVGISKIPRMVEMYARRLQVQERMTQQIADALQSVNLAFEGCRHLCSPSGAFQCGIRPDEIRMPGLTH